MPVYCYTTAEGATIERIFPRNGVPGGVVVDGRMAWRDRQAEGVHVPSTAGWPMPPCLGSGVHASQAGELRDFFKKSGVPTEVTSDGDPVYRDKNHRARALAARNLYDRN